MEPEIIDTAGSPAKEARDMPAVNNFARSREIEAHADEMLADADSGMMVKDICVKWGISRKAFENLRRRRGLIIGPAKSLNSMIIMNIVDQIFEQETDIKAAEMRWTGAKSVLQMMGNK